MKPFYTILFNVIFALNLLLVFFLLVEDQIVVPHLVQPIGRLHPMLLHLPIGFLLLLVLLPLLRDKLGAVGLYQMQLFVLTLTSLTAALSAIMGFLLARESGYGGELVDQHKWAGLGVSWMTYGLLICLKKWPNSRRVFQFGTWLSVIVLLLAGHLGAGITHGEDYVFAPIQYQEAGITEESPVYEALIVPVLQQKCFSCHNPRKAKGGLIMSDWQKFKKGGDKGEAFVPGDAEESIMIKRLDLPLEDEEHMPPKGKPQLNREEVALLKDWIQSGAPRELPLKDLPADHPLKPLAEQAISKPEVTTEVNYDFAAASEALIEELNIPFRTLSPIAVGSPALSAAIFIRETYEPRFLEELLRVKGQLVALKLDNLPIDDEALSIIGQFSRLEKLNLNNTDISGENLDVLATCSNLRSLSLSGTPVDTSVAATLRQLPDLQHLFVWNTQLDTGSVRYLEEQFPKLNIQLGYIPDETELLKLSPPIVKTELNLEGREEIRLQHSLPGAIIRYTFDGSDPDSLESNVYEGPLQPAQYTVIKARAFSENWLGSGLAKTTYFPPSIPIKEAVLLKETKSKFKGSGASGLIDGKKGFSNNHISPFWMGFRDVNFEALFFPEDPSISIRTITLSYLQRMGPYIMPPRSVEVWGGPNAQNLQLLKRVSLGIPTTYLPDEVKGLDIEIPASNWDCYKIVAKPIRSLPDWHQGKGDQAWIFVDEVYFYGKASAALVPQVD